MDCPGIIPNAFVHIFNHISVTKDKEFLIRASFIEIYNEEVRDLLGKVRLDPSAGSGCRCHGRCHGRCVQQLSIKWLPWMIATATGSGEEARPEGGP